VNSASGHWPRSVCCLGVRLVSFRLTDWCCHTGSYCYPTPKRNYFLLSKEAFLSLDLATRTGCSGRLNRTVAVTDVRWNVGLALTRSCSRWLGPSSLFCLGRGWFCFVWHAYQFLSWHSWSFLSCSPTWLVLISRLKDTQFQSTLFLFTHPLYSIVTLYLLLILGTYIFYLFLSSTNVLLCFGHSKRFAINWALLGFRDPAHL
jgi:hypothetical protein